MATQTTYQIIDTVEGSFTATISRDGLIEFDPGNDMPFASRALMIGDRMIAENINYEAIRIDDAELVKQYLIGSGEWTDEDLEEARKCHLSSALGGVLDGADRMLDNATHEAQIEAIQRLIEEENWDGFRLDGRFANEYTLYLVANGKDCPDEDAYALTAEEWAEAWGRYPDPITQSYVSTVVIQ